MTREQATGIAFVLSDDPFYYRNFGVWWWWVKRELKRNGYTQANLAHLGAFEDAACVEHYYEGMTPEELDDEAFEYQADAATRSRDCPIATTPDGEVYQLHDEDAE